MDSDSNDDFANARHFPLMLVLMFGDGEGECLNCNQTIQLKNDGANDGATFNGQIRLRSQKHSPWQLTPTKPIIPNRSDQKQNSDDSDDHHSTHRSFAVN